jgi:sec-independent protein translocase protein TatB
MFGIGGQELILLMLIGLVVLGPEKLPRVANQLGNWLGQARRMTRVMKRQLEEELDLNKPNIKPPPASREPSFQPPKETPVQDDYTPPREDDDYSPAHGADEPGTGVGDEVEYTEEDVAAADSELDAVLEANEPAADVDTDETKEAS